MRRYELDYYISTLDSDELQHHGILGQKWGVRRYQNPDGSLTAEGRDHYTKYTKAAEARGQKWGNRLKNKTGYRNALTAHKLYSATKGITPSTLDWDLPRRRVGTMRKAAFVKGMYEGATGKKMAAEKYRALQNSLAKEHRDNVRRDLVGYALAGSAVIGSGLTVAGVATANPALAVGGQALTIGSSGALGVNKLAQTGGRMIRAGVRTYELNKEIQKTQRKRGTKK